MLNRTESKRLVTRRVRWSGVLALGLAISMSASCKHRVPNSDPTGLIFPTVRGESLDGVAYTFPNDTLGEPLLLLIGYEQRTQFDIDRWLFGLDDAQVQVKAFEVPTIPGWVPGMISGTIDQGMRSGIPKPDWAAVITVYEDAEAIVDFTGNEDAISARVVLLDATGRVCWFHDQGYSVSALRELEAAVEDAKEGGTSKTNEVNEMSEAAGENSRTLEDVERFKIRWNELNIESMAMLGDVYTADVHFQDPVKDIRGIESLRNYFAHMYEGVAEIHFDFTDQIVGEGSAALMWEMKLRHKTFRSGETLTLPGISHVTFRDGKVAYHRDYFDLGQMIYERVPLLGRIIKYIKAKL